MNSLIRALLPSLTSFLILGSAAPSAIAQMPRTISFQGVLANANGTLVSDGVHQLTLRLYDAANAASAIYLETHDATVVRGVFNVIIGSQSPLPASLAFDRAYFLGVSVGSEPELVPRTPLTAVPYALRASIADDVSASATVVRSVNGRSGELTLQGAGATTVTQNGATITISSTGGAGATGIQGVQNTDGAITVTNPNGPVATLGLADSSINGRRLASNAVVSAHLADTSVGTSELKDASVTQSKIAAGVTVPPSGPAGGDLNGSYPSPSIRPGSVTTTKLADNSVTTDKIDADAITSAKILNGTIEGRDINQNAALTVGTLTTSGNASIGAGIGAARLTVQGSGATSTTNALDVNDNTAGLLLRVRDNGAVGFGITTPGARLDIAGLTGAAINVRSGSIAVSTATVVAGPAVALPNATSVQILDNAVAAPVLFVFPAAPSAGQIMYISNDDADAVVGPFPIASGQTRAFIFVGGFWRLVN